MSAASSQAIGDAHKVLQENSLVPLRESTHEVRYLDTQKLLMSTAVAFWADKAAETLFDPPPWHVDPNSSFVVRKLTMKIISREIVKEKVKTCAHFDRIGTTSFSSMYEICTEDGALVAQVWSLCVCCTVSGMNPIPIKEKEKLVLTPNLPKPDAELTALEHGFPTSEPAYSWESKVRITDCDLFGHLNNTKYPTMAEEALAAAVHDNAFASCPEVEAAARRETKFMHVEFLDQALPFTSVKVCIWWWSQRKAFVMKFLCEDKVLTEVLISTEENINNPRSRV